MARPGVSLFFTFFIAWTIPEACSAAELAPWRNLHGSWAALDRCDVEAERWFVFAGGFRAPSAVCAASSRTKTKTGYSIFLECQTGTGQVTYMGDVFVESKSRIRFGLTEYRSGGGAPDVNEVLFRCAD